jgi:hypothetical protein
MRKPTLVPFTVIAALTLALLAFGKSETVSGQLIDLACYSIDKDNTGNHHKNKGLMCARACALEGFAVGVLTAAGKVYEVTGPLAANSNAKLVPYMGQAVTLTGEVSERDGKSAIAAEDIR